MSAQILLSKHDSNCKSSQIINNNITVTTDTSPGSVSVDGLSDPGSGIPSPYAETSTIPTYPDPMQNFKNAYLAILLQVISSDKALLNNLIEPSGKVLLRADWMITLISAITGVDDKNINIAIREVEAGCFAKLPLFRDVVDILVNGKSMYISYNETYNKLKNFNIDLQHVIPI